MSWLKIFSKTPSPDTTPVEPEETIVPKTPKFEEPVYTVGVNNDGNTVLKLHDSGGITMSLALSPKAVEQLIKLLAVTIEPQESEKTDV